MDAAGPARAAAGEPAIQRPPAGRAADAAGDAGPAPQGAAAVETRRTAGPGVPPDGGRPGLEADRGLAGAVGQPVRAARAGPKGSRPRVSDVGRAPLGGRRSAPAPEGRDLLPLPRGAER